MKSNQTKERKKVMNQKNKKANKTKMK